MTNHATRRARKDEEGSALILALAMITVVALMLAVVLDFTDTGLLATPAFVEQRDILNEVDGAVEGAINSVRGSTLLGTVGSPINCGPFEPYKNDPGLSEVDVTVSCTAQTSTTGVGIAENQPPFAVMTVGDQTGEGFYLAGNEMLTVDGGMYSRGVIDAKSSAGTGAQSAIQSYGDLLAEKGCNPTPPGSVFTSLGGIRDCNVTPVDAGKDPNYPPAILALPSAIDPAATCPGGANGLVEFLPGLYSEIPVAPPTCTGDVWWFSPGIYYFDFPDGTAAWDPAVDIVGGTLKAPVTTSSTSVPIPGACDEAADGVQFIFGGESRLSMAHASIELCGSVNATNHEEHKIVYYGLKTGTRSTETDKTFLETGTPATAAGSEVPFLLPANAKTMNESPTPLYASAVLNGNVNSADSASLSLPAFDDVPAGATITSTKLRVRHGASATGAEPKLTVALPAITALSRPAFSKDYDLNKNCLLTSPCTSVVDITSDLRGTFKYLDVNGLSATYNARLKSSLKTIVTDNVDGAELFVTYIVPGFEATTCPTTELDCSVLASKVDLDVVFHGTVYTPTARLFLELNNKDTNLFERGVVARTMTANASSSFKQTDSPFQLPNKTVFRQVLFVASVDGVDKLRALVEYQDFKPDTAGEPVAFPGYAVKVLKWSVLR